MFDAHAAAVIALERSDGAPLRRVAISTDPVSYSPRGAQVTVLESWIYATAAQEALWAIERVSLVWRHGDWRVSAITAPRRRRTSRWPSCAHSSSSRGRVMRRFASALAAARAGGVHGDVVESRRRRTRACSRRPAGSSAASAGRSSASARRSCARGCRRRGRWRRAPRRSAARRSAARAPRAPAPPRAPRPGARSAA